MIIKTTKRKQISATLLLLMMIFLLLSPAVYAQQEEDIVVQVDDFYKGSPESGQTYDVLLIHDEGTAGDIISFEVGITVGKESGNFDGMSIEVPEGMALVEVKDVNSSTPEKVDGVTTRYITGSTPDTLDKIYGTFYVLGIDGQDASYKDNGDTVAKNWTVMYEEAVAYEEDIASTQFGRILLSTADWKWDDRLVGNESIVLFFDAVAGFVINAFTFYGVRPDIGEEPLNKGDALPPPFIMVSSEVIVKPRDPEPVVPPGSFEPGLPDSDFTFPEEPLADRISSPLEEDASVILISAPVSEVFSPVEEPVAVPVVVDNSEIELLPETPETEPFGQASIVKWPFFLLLAVPVMVWLAASLMVLVRVPGSDGSLKTLSRKLARRKDKKWHVDVEKELDKYLAKHGEVMVDFRGGLIKGANKAVYSGDTVLSTDEMRYAIINKQRYTSWVDELKKQASQTA